MPAFILGLAAVAASLIGANAAYKLKAAANAVAVTGSAERVIISDTAKWTANFNRQVDPSHLKEGSDQLNKDLNAVLAAFKAKGIKDGEITVQPPSTSGVCDSQNNVIYGEKGTVCGGNHVSGYNLSQTVIVESPNVDTVTKLSLDAPGALTAAGLIFSSQSLEYYYTKLADVRLELLDEATANAKERAEHVAKATGARIGRVTSAGQGVFQVTPVNSTEISDYGVYDTTALQKKVTAVVRVSFSLE